MKRYISIIKQAGITGMLLLAAGFTANAQETISLQAAVDRTLANNLTIKQSLINEALGGEDLQQAKNNLLPSLNATTNGGYNFGRTLVPGQLLYTTASSFIARANAQLQVTLFQGGQLRNQILQNRLLLDVNKGQTAKLKNDLILNVVTTYLQILTNQDLVTAAQQQIQLADQTLKRTDISFKVGNQTLADLSQAKAQVSTATLNSTTAQNQLDLSMLTLKQLMEMDPMTPIVVEKPDISKLNNIKIIYDAKEVVQTALGINPDVLLAERQEKTFAQAIKIAKGDYYPTLSFVSSLGSDYSNRLTTRIVDQSAPYIPQIGLVGGAGGTPVYALRQVQDPIIGRYPGWSQIRDNFNQYVGLSLQIPIFNRFNTRTNVRKAQLNYQNAQLSTQISKNNLSKTIIQAVQDLNAADKQYQSALQTFEANKEALNVTQQRYNVGLVNSLDYNTAVTNHNRAQNDMIQARYSVIFRSKIIDYYIGNTITL